MAKFVNHILQSIVTISIIAIVHELDALECHGCVHSNSGPNETCLDLKSSASGKHQGQPSGRSLQASEKLEEAGKASGGTANIEICSTYCGRDNGENETTFIRTRLKVPDSKPIGKCEPFKAGVFDGYWCPCSGDYCNNHLPESIPSCPFKTKGTGSEKPMEPSSTTLVFNASPLLVTTLLSLLHSC